MEYRKGWQTEEKIERQKDTEKQKDRKAERQKSRKTEKQKDKKIQKSRKTERQKDRKTERQKDRKISIWFDKRRKYKQTKQCIECYFKEEKNRETEKIQIVEMEYRKRWQTEENTNRQKGIFDRRKVYNQLTERRNEKEKADTKKDRQKIDKEDIWQKDKQTDKIMYR